MQEDDVTRRLLLTGRSHLSDAETTMLLCRVGFAATIFLCSQSGGFVALSRSKGNYAEAEARISTVFIIGEIGKSSRIALITNTSEGRC